MALCSQTVAKPTFDDGHEIASQDLVLKIAGEETIRLGCEISVSISRRDESRQRLEAPRLGALGGSQVVASIVMDSIVMAWPQQLWPGPNIYGLAQMVKA